MSDEDKKVKLPKVKLKKLPKRVTIQTLEEYVTDYKLPTPRPDVSKFPDLFAPKLEKKKRDDIQSKVAVLQGTPGTNLYASLLVAIAQAEKITENNPEGEK